MNAVHIVGRVLLAGIFIAAGFNKFLQVPESLAYMRAFGLPDSMVLLMIAAGIELVGGFALLLGFKDRVVAGLIAAYLIPVTFIFHTNFNDPEQFITFLKNLAIIGGLLQIVSLKRELKGARSGVEVPSSAPVISPKSDVSVGGPEPRSKEEPPRVA